MNVIGLIWRLALAFGWSLLVVSELAASLPPLCAPQQFLAAEVQEELSAPFPIMNKSVEFVYDEAPELGLRLRRSVAQEESTSCKRTAEPRFAGVGMGGGFRSLADFTGKERDAETGLDYFGARYMSAAQGRFTSPDPYMPSADVKDPQSWNRYVYARNNPLRFIDPNGLDWSDLSDEQKRVFQSYAETYNKDNKSKLSSEQVYNTLNSSQMATFESVTYALEHTQLVDSKGNGMGNALQLVAGVSKIAGETPGSSKGDEQFRIFADLKPGAVETFGKAQGFEPSSNKVLGLFQIYHQGFPDSFRQTRREGVTGMEAGVQPSYNRNTLRSDIDVDYRFGGAHLQPANSDVRAPGNYQKFIDRWPGLRNWWDKK